MSNKMYPVLAPKIFYTHLNEELALLVDDEASKTQKLNYFQTKVVDLCNGKNSVEEIHEILCADNCFQYDIQSIKNFIGQLVKYKYLHWTPVPVTLEGSRGVLTKDMHEKKRGELFYTRQIAGYNNIYYGCMLF